MCHDHDQILVPDIEHLPDGVRKGFFFELIWRDDATNCACREQNVMVVSKQWDLL